MKNSIVLILIALLIASLSACAPEQAPEVVERTVKTVNVKAVSLLPTKFESKYTVVGHVVSENDVTLSSEANGRIITYFVNRGNYVENGQKIAKIDDTLLKMDLQRQSALVNQSKENYLRLQRLWEQEKIGTEIDFLNAKYAYEQNQAVMENIKEQISRTVLTAPFSGKIDQILTEVGESVMPGTPMVRLIDISQLKVRVGVPSRYASVVNIGDRATIDFRMEGVKPLTTSITFVGSSIDPKSRTFTVEADILDAKNILKIDSEASVTISTESFDNVLVLPHQYIFRNENGYQVYVISKDEDGNTVARARAVQLGPLSGNSRIIEKGISTKDRVITEGFALVEDRMRVKVIDEATFTSID